MDENRFELERAWLVRTLVAEGYLSKPDVIRAMRKVPRHQFVSREIQHLAYCDSPLEIGEGQTISAPHMVAIMTEHLDLKPAQKVLEIGTGSGYHAAVVAEVIGPEGRIHTVERISSLVERARANLAQCGYRNVTVHLGDGSKGLPEFAPYDRIFVTCAAPDIPQPLIEQLRDDGGKLLVPVGGRYMQELIGCIKTRGKLHRENYGGCVFVPLIGEYGYKSQSLAFL